VIFLYAALKFAAYSGWCWVGLRLFDPNRPDRTQRALAFGGLRLLMGLGFGAAIFFMANAAVMIVRSQPVVYLAVYVPVRWIEWGLIEALMRPELPFLKTAALGDGAAARGWRARGILLSCLADLPIIASIGGLPLGRFMC
jgi:hypothetical protein